MALTSKRRPSNLVDDGRAVEETSIFSQYRSHRPCVQDYGIVQIGSVDGNLGNKIFLYDIFLKTHTKEQSLNKTDNWSLITDETCLFLFDT